MSNEINKAYEVKGDVMLTDSIYQQSWADLERGMLSNLPSLFNPLDNHYFTRVSW